MTKKRKTKQLRWLVTGLMLAMTMVMPTSTWAQEQVMYTVYKDGTLTFEYDNKPEGDNVYDVPTDPNTTPGWISHHQADITKVVFNASFKDVRPTSCYSWFCGFSKLTTIEGIENLNTANVTDMSYMFCNCEGLTSLTLPSSFSTAKVTNMSNMFYNCSGLKSLTLSNSFNTAMVENMSDMFRDCSSLESLDLSSFNTANVTDMSSMFYNCSTLPSLDVSNFNTEKVKDMGAMFGVCLQLSSLDLSSFNTAMVTVMSYMFYNCSKLTSLTLSSFFNTANVRTMGSMFNNCKKLTSLDLSKFNTANVRTMGNMFDGCQQLTSLDLSNFNTAKVTYMGSMFSSCSGLTSLDLSSFNTANVGVMDDMFNGCSGLTTIYVSDDFKIGNDTNGDKMFSGCSKLEGVAKYSQSNTGKSMANYNTGYFKTYYKLGENQVDLYGVSLTTNSLNLDLSGDNDFVAHAPFTANTVKYSRDLSKSESKWFSLCLPFAYTPNNFTAYKLKGASANAVEIEEITTKTIAAGTPVLFKFNDGVKKEINISETKAEIVKAPVVGAKVNGPDGSLQLCGTYQSKTFSSDDNNAFILLKDKLMNPAKMLDTGVTKVGVNPFRAYMTLTASAQTSSARAFSIGHGGEEGTTAIDLLNSVATDDAEYYDINGRRIDAPVKGVNIVRRGNKTIKLIIK